MKLLLKYDFIEVITMYVNKICFALIFVLYLFVCLPANAQESTSANNDALEAEIKRLNNIMMDVRESNKKLMAQMKDQNIINEELRDLIKSKKILISSFLGIATLK